MPKDIFISHAWGINEEGKNNHESCKKICNKLISNGYSVWFDDYEMVGNIDKNIIKGINGCKVVIICLTEKYINKINDAIILNKPNDNCFKEWNYTLFKNKIIIPIIMEEKTKNIFLNSDGIIQMYLNNYMFLDFCDIDKMDDYNLLVKTLRSFQVYNKREKTLLKIKSENSLDKLARLGYNNLESLSPKKKNKTINSNNKKKYFNIRFNNFKFFKSKKNNANNDVNNNINNNINRIINKNKNNNNNNNNNKVVKSKIVTQIII
tara:strand:+ start:1063 stop:1854 length:792 start_codon:yes stop_codon:yes gene_type:complete